MLVNAEKPGWGTAMEIFYAHMKGKPVLFFTSNDNPSPWLLARARQVSSLKEAISELKKFQKTIIECIGCNTPIKML
jgi:nucleoside 2-deoxyribosyltransferase